MKRFVATSVLILTFSIAYRRNRLVIGLIVSNRVCGMAGRDASSGGLRTIAEAVIFLEAVHR